MASNPSRRIDQFLLMHSARADQWRGIAIDAENWSEVKTGRAKLEEAIEAIAPAEGFFAYPGPALFGALRERVAAGRFAAAAVESGVRRIVYLGGLVPRWDAEHPPAAGEQLRRSRHLASREAVERTLLDAVPDSIALRASTMTWRTAQVLRSPQSAHGR